ncbi:MAG: glycerol-3-phosphate acyltransferase [Oscillospiraceae bacterium]
MDNTVSLGNMMLEWGLGFWLPALAAAVIAYFCGCFNGAVIVSKYILRDDVRNHGSGNAGLTNFFRTFGGPLTAVVILTDVLKAVAALLVSGAIFRHFVSAGGDVHLFSEYWAGVFCLLGHMFPCMFHFRGGKGILSGGTIAIMIDWRVALVVWGGFLLLTVLTRYVSLGSLWAGASFPFISWFCYPNPVIVVLAFACGGLVVWQHRGNARRLLSGTERKLSLHHKKEKEQ